MRKIKSKNIFVKIKRLTPFFLILLLSLAFTFPIFKSINNLGRSDWDLFCYIDEVPRKTILEYHQFPLWDPYGWGGSSLIAGIQAGYLRPTFLFTLLFGCVVGLKIEIFFMIALGMTGMFLLSRYYKMSAVAGLLSASIFGLSSFFSIQMSAGHVWVFPFMYLPFIFLFFLLSLQQRWYVIPAAIFLVFVSFAGGNAHVMPLICFFLAIYGLVVLIKCRDIQPLINLFFIFLLMFGLGSIKILPSLEHAIENPRPTDTQDQITTMRGLYYVFLDREQFVPKRSSVQKWGLIRHGAYTGILPLILFVYALLLFWKKETALIISGLLALIVSIGGFAKWAPWNLLHKLPLLSSTRLPSRFIVLVVFCISILAGLAFESFYKKAKKSWKAKYFFMAILIFIFFDLLVVNTKPFTQAFPNLPSEVSPGEDFHQIRDSNSRRSGGYSSMYLNLLANQGTINGYADSANVKASVKAAGDADYRGEVYLNDIGQAVYKYWSPNRLVVNLETENENQLIINQNYEKGWRVKGKVAENFEGLLSTNVTSSDKVIEFYYLPSSFLIGAIITLFSTVGVIIFWTKSNR